MSSGARAGLAESVGVDAGTVTKWCSGDAAPDPEHLPKVAKFLGFSCDYLLGATSAPSQRAIEPATDEPPKDWAGFDRVALSATVGAGPARIVDLEQQPDADAKLYAFHADFLRKHGGKKNVRVVDVATGRHAGRSMIPTIQPGARLLLDVRPVEKSSLKSGGLYVVRADEGVVVKRVFVSDGQLVLWSDNPDYAPRAVVHPFPKGEQFHRVIVGRVVWIGQELEG